MNMFGYWLVAFIAMASFAGQCGFYWIAGGFTVLAAVSGAACTLCHLNSKPEHDIDNDASSS